MIMLHIVSACAIAEIAKTPYSYQVEERALRGGIRCGEFRKYASPGDSCRFWSTNHCEKQ